MYKLLSKSKHLTAAGDYTVAQIIELFDMLESIIPENVETIIKKDLN